MFQVCARLILVVIGILFAASPVIIAQKDRELVRETPKVSEKRTALVIGNANYTTARKLNNPVNDATDMSAALKELGFEVITGTDLTLRQMREKVREFGDKLKANGGVGLFYYAGHGVQVDGINYLIPTDADIARGDEISFNAFSLEQVFRKIETAGNGFNIVILDACRNNPFARSWSRSVASDGLALVSAPTGTFIAYASDINRTADDGPGRNGIYTGELLKTIRKPNLKIEETFKEIQKSVRLVSNGKQVPWISSSFSGDFYFLPQTQRVDAEDLYWAEIKGRDTRSAYELYLAEYPSGRYGAEAKNQIDRFKQEDLKRLREIERSKWRDAQRSNSKDLYDAYLESYPNGEFAKEARSAISTLQVMEEQTKWNEVQILNRKMAFQSYLSEYPNGKYVQTARQKIREYEDAEAVARSAQEKATEKAKWDEAEIAKTVEGFQNYLTAYPQGEFAELARLRLRDFAPTVVSQPLGTTWNVFVKDNANLRKLDAAFDAGNQLRFKIQFYAQERLRAGFVIVSKTEIVFQPTPGNEGFSVAASKIIDVVGDPGAQNAIAVRLKVALNNSKGDVEEMKDFVFFNPSVFLEGQNFRCTDCDTTMGILFAFIQHARGRDDLVK